MRTHWSRAALMAHQPCMLHAPIIYLRLVWVSCTHILNCTAHNHLGSYAIPACGVPLTLSVAVLPAPFAKWQPRRQPSALHSGHAACEGKHVYCLPCGDYLVSDGAVFPALAERAVLLPNKEPLPAAPSAINHMNPCMDICAHNCCKLVSAPKLARR